MRKPSSDRSIVTKRELYVTSSEAAAILGRPDRWLRNQRRLRRGPPWVVFRGRTPLYLKTEVEAWRDAQFQPPPPKLKKQA